MPIIRLMVRENHKMVREMSGKSQEICEGSWLDTLIENEGVVGAAPTGDAPTTSE